MFDIKLGVPEIESLWFDLQDKVDTNKASKTEKLIYRKLGKTFFLLAKDPKYPSLKSHEIDALTRRYGMKVFESYLENNKPAAGRIFWVYGPNKNEITIIGIEPHPNDKVDSYKKITLSKFTN